MRTPLALLFASLCLGVQAATPAAPAVQENPLLAKWTTPFGLPPFDQIKDEHFQPAYEVAIAAKRAEVLAIANNPAPATFANTIEALDKAGELLNQVEGVFSNLNSADTNDARQLVAKNTAAKLAALQDDIRLNEKLFARVSSVWQARDSLKLTEPQAKLLSESYKAFVRGGANLPADKKERFRAINSQLAELGVAFNENLIKETNAYKLVLDKKEDLDGLPDRVIKSASAAAEKAGLKGKYLFTLHYPSIWPFMENSTKRELRRELLAAYANRGSNGNANDNRKIIAQMATLRAERAALLGFKVHADYVLEERMAKNSDNVYGLLNKLWTPALAVAKREAQAMQDTIKAEGRNFALEASDWHYYAAKVKKARYDIDENETRAYFPLDQVRDGAFEVAHRLYGITFTERKDLPVYNPEVRSYEVKDADGSHLGIFMTDYFSRSSKRNGAWMQNFRVQHFEGDKDVRPNVINVCNFSRPTGDAPALLSIDETETLFHEFGHALHYLFSKVPYASLARTPRDFVELPSQIMENWVLEPETLKFYAKHYKTGEVIPDSLIAKIKASRTFNEGFKTVEYLAACYLDLDWNTLKPGSTVEDATAFENASFKKMGLMPEIISRYKSSYFLHIWVHGYDAGYYGYIWCGVLDADAFEAFKEKGLFDKATAAAFRREILSKVGSGDYPEMYRRFRGRDPEVGPLLKRRGLE